MQGKRASIYVRCTPEEADKIRQAARAERRTISGYILNAALSRIELRNRMRREILERQARENNSAA
jgi:uncharacterized protein (DUF1778 family)